MISAVLHRVILQTALRSLLSVVLYCCFFSLDKFTRELHLHGLFFRTALSESLFWNCDLLIHPRLCFIQSGIHMTTGSVLYAGKSIIPYFLKLFCRAFVNSCVTRVYLWTLMNYCSICSIDFHWLLHYYEAVRLLITCRLILNLHNLAIQLPFFGDW